MTFRYRKEVVYLEPCVESDGENDKDTSYSDHDVSKEDLIIKIEKNKVAVFHLGNHNSNEGLQTGIGNTVPEDGVIKGGDGDTAAETETMVTGSETMVTGSDVMATGSVPMAMTNTGDVDEGFSEEAQNNPRVENSTGETEGQFFDLNEPVKIDPHQSAKKEKSEEGGAAAAEAERLKNEVMQLAKQLEKSQTPEKQTPEKQMSWYTCPVCCENVTNKVLLLKHMQLHRVWILRTPEGLSANGVDAIFEALNMRMPNVPQGLTDRETGLAIEEVLISKAPAVAAKVTPVHLLNVHPTGLEIPAEQPVIQSQSFDGTTHLDHTNSFEQTNGSFTAVSQGDMSTTVTIDESALRDLGLLLEFVITFYKLLAKQ